jgi:ATP-dependent DNA helicase PIF1
MSNRLSTTPTFSHSCMDMSHIRPDDNQSREEPSRIPNTQIVQSAPQERRHSSQRSNVPHPSDPGDNEDDSSDSNEGGGSPPPSNPHPSQEDYRLGPMGGKPSYLPLGEAGDGQWEGMNSLGRPDDHTGLQDLRDKLIARHNVCALGMAGAGKSTALLGWILPIVRARLVALGETEEATDECIMMGSLTGVSGLRIGADTIHSAAGLGLGQGAIEDLYKRMSPSTKAKWTRRNLVVIIDEISVCSDHLFNTLYRLGEHARSQRHNRTMDQVEWVVLGDFLQLGPVGGTVRRAGANNDTDNPNDYSKMGSGYAFQAHAWAGLHFANYVLVGARRAESIQFAQVLDHLSVGWASPAVRRALETAHVPREGPGIPQQLQHHYSLHPLRDTVRTRNHREIRRLIERSMQEGDRPQVHTYVAVDGPDGRAGRQQWKHLYNCLQPEPTLLLTVGAKVMCLRNISERVRNGSIGRVVGWTPRWNAVPDAMAKMMAGTERDINREQATQIARRVCQDMVFPIVRFDGDDEPLFAMPPMRFEDVDQHGDTVVYRWQVPLALGYALTTNKAQGLTLPRVMIEVERGYNAGQAYTAVSRVQRLSRLAVLNEGVDVGMLVKVDMRPIRWLKAPERNWRRVHIPDLHARHHDQARDMNN